MHKHIEKIKSNESQPKIIKNIFNKNEIKEFLNLYIELPLTVHNKRQNVKKKRWLKEFRSDLENLFRSRLENEIGSFKYDNLVDDSGKEILGLFQESYNPIGLHIDGGFNYDNIIFKQTLIPLTDTGSTVIFKNRFYDYSTNFTINDEELNEKNLKYGQNRRSSKHIGFFGSKPFDETIHKKYLNHEKIENLIGLEVDTIYEWEIGSMLIFDRTNLHCSSSIINEKKIGLTTFTKK